MFGSNAFEQAATKVNSWKDLNELYDHVFFIMDKSKSHSQKLVGVFSTFEKAEIYREKYMKITKTWDLPQAIQIYPMALDYWLLNSDDDVLKELRRADQQWQKRKPELKPSSSGVKMVRRTEAGENKFPEASIAAPPTTPIAAESDMIVS